MYRMAQATKLKQIRESLGATQEGVTRRTRSLAVRTYVRAEDGERVTYGTAKQIPTQLTNCWRSGEGHPSLWMI